MASDEVGRLKTLIEINALINSQYRDFRILLSRIMESAQKLIGSDASSLLLLEAGNLHFEVALGEKGDAVKKYTLRAGEGIAGWVAQHNRSLLVNDVKNDPRHMASIGEDVGYQTRNLIAVPLIIKEKTLGVLEVINKSDGNKFTEDDMQLLEVLANQAAITLQNSRHYDALTSELKILKRQPASIPGQNVPLLWKNPGMKKILEKLEKMSVTDSPILILGETGTGKELVAEHIHTLSQRNNGPLVRINCAAIAPGLVDSVLFGHVKGAFTDAEFDKRGLFEQASGGTLFLDEIGELTLDVQVKLLRVLQVGIFQKVGGEEDLYSNVRIIAATNRNLKEINFRQDLYYRLAVLTLEIPPLRNRPDDIESIARFFLNARYSENSELPNEFSLEALDSLLTYHWPGNIRELKNAVERATIMAWGKKVIEPGDLELEDKKHTTMYEGRTLKDTMNQFKKNIITKSLQRHAGNQTLTARALGIQRTYLSRIMRDLSIR